MPAFGISFMRVDRDEERTTVESFTRTADWPLLPREGEGVDLGEEDTIIVESVGHDFDGYPNVFLGRRRQEARLPWGTGWGRSHSHWGADDMFVIVNADGSGLSAIPGVVGRQPVWRPE